MLDDVLGNICQALQILLATSWNAMSLKKRGLKVPWMTWRVMAA
jgi:hypothetical protein